MIVQIYEIQTPQEAERCIELGVDHVGSVIPNESEWQQPVLKDTIGVSDGTRVKNSIIPLFQEIETLCRVLDYYRPDFIHFCESLTDKRGHEIDLDYFIDLQLKIKEQFPQVSIIRSIPIPVKGSASQFPSLGIAGRLEPVSDFFLTDTWLGGEPVEGFIGITGQTCDSNMARELVLQSGVPVILAGGLSPENVYDALIEVRPAGADSCTKTNKEDKKGNPIRFKKDFDKIKRFVEEVRRCEVDQESKGMDHMS
jgi:phosphoribosylanthranilate isomerase